MKSAAIWLCSEKYLLRVHNYIPSIYIRDRVNEKGV